MKFSRLREAVTGEHIKDVFVEFDDVLYDISDLVIQRVTKHRGKLILSVSRLDEIDGSGLTGEDLL